MGFKINLSVCQFARSFLAMLILKQILCIEYLYTFPEKFLLSGF